MTIETFFHVLGHTCLDALKTLPILLLAYWLISFFEHSKQENFIHKMTDNVSTVFVGSLLSIVPQCAFSAFSADMYAKKKIPVGTLIAIFIACSDEALPLLISQLGNKATIWDILFLVLGKIILAIVIGLIINLIFSKRKNKYEIHHHHHEDDDCHCCADSVFIDTIKQTLKIFVIVLVSTFVINLAIELITLEKLQAFMLSAGGLSIFLVALVGLIPSCASSILIIEMFLSNIITFGSMFAGLVAGAGLGYIVLFKRKRPVWKNILIVLFMYAIGVASGLVINLIGYYL